MAQAAYEGIEIQEVSKTVTYTSRYWDDCLYENSDGDCRGGWDYSTGSTDITINGKLIGDSIDVFIGGKKASYVGGETVETDSWIRPSDYYSGVTIHSNTTGNITSGNSNNVFVNGKLLAIKGSAILTHEGVVSSVLEGSTTVNVGT